MFIGREGREAMNHWASVGEEGREAEGWNLWKEGSISGTLIILKPRNRNIL